MNTIDIRHVLLLIIVAAGITATALTPAFPQDPHFHDFADKRPLLGIPYCMDVMSNLGFLLAGVLGMALQRQRRWLSQPLARLLLAYCGSLVLVGAGSIYYHLDPSNHTLLWDRLPMTITFSLFFCLILASHLSTRLAFRLLPLMLATGVMTTLYWYHSELAGAGDLRFYAAFQFLPMLLAIVILLLFPSRELRKPALAMTLLLYILAKLAEVEDAGIFALTGFMSGHTLKHLLAAVGAWCVIIAAPARHASSARSPFPEYGTAQ